MTEASAFVPLSSCREDTPEADWHQYGLLAAWWSAGAVCLLLYGREVYHNPFDAQKIIVILGLVFWLKYLAAIAKASLRCTSAWRATGGTNLVAAWGIALPTMLWQIGRTFPLERGYPAVEASIVSCVCTFSGLLPMKSILLLNTLYGAVSMFNVYSGLFTTLGGLKHVAVNFWFGFPSCCILCLARNRVNSQTTFARAAASSSPSSVSSSSVAASEMAAPAVRAIIGMTAMLAVSSCIPDGPASVQESWSPLDHVGLALRAALAAVAAAAATAMVSAATTAWLPPGTGTLERWMKRPRFAALWAKCGLAEAHPVPPSQCCISALLFPEWAQSGEKWLLEAVSQDMAETVLATMAALFMSTRFIVSVTSFICGQNYLWSPTQDMLSMFAGITLGSSKGQHLQNFLSVQRRMYRSAATLLRGVVPGHVADVMEANKAQEEEELQAHSALQPNTKSLTPTSSNADRLFGSFARVLPASSEIVKAEAEERSLSGTFGNPPEQQSSPKTSSPAGSKNSRSLSMNSAKQLIAPALAKVQRLEASRSCTSRLTREPSFSPHWQEGQNTFLERHEDVTIVFCDLVGFTALSEQITPHEVMCLLGDLYRKYDELAAKLKLYTLDTIGDCYMCAANLIHPLEGHVDAAVGFAQSIIEIASRTFSSLGKPLSVRVGLHTGPVIAGILGYHRFKFTTVSAGNVVEEC